MLHAARWKHRTQKVDKNGHLGTIAQLCRAVSSQIRHVSTIAEKLVKPRMWANAQPDGRPAERSWRPLFNAAVWLTPTTSVPCSNAAKTRNPLKFVGNPKLPDRSLPLVGWSSPYCGPYCGNNWRRYCCLTSLSACRYVPYLLRYSPTNLCNGAQMAIFGDFLRPVFSASRVQHLQTYILNSH